MSSLFIFFVIMFMKCAEAADSGTDSPIITFNIQYEQANGSSTLTCDHSKEEAEQNINIYTAYEGETFTIVIAYSGIVKRIECATNSNRVNKDFHFNDPYKNITVLTPGKGKGSLWNCEILVHRDNPGMLPVGQYKQQLYSLAYCFMRIHVREKVAPQTILVNNVVLPAVRTNLSEKDVDFIAEYQYDDGDEVNVTCINLLNEAVLKILYYGIMPDSTYTTGYPSPSKMMGFIRKVHSGHNNTYMICTRTEADDYTKVMVKLSMETTRHFNNIVFLKINGMRVRPYLDYPGNNSYHIEYKYHNNQLIDLTCEVKRTDVKLFVSDSWKTEQRPNNKAEMRVLLSRDEQLECATEYLNGTSAETVAIHFTAGDLPIDNYPLHMALPNHFRLLEIYSDYINVIVYEFEYGETLQITCGQLRLPPSPGPVLYLKLGSEICETDGCSVSKTLHVTRNDHKSSIGCCIIEKSDIEIQRRLIKVILIERDLTSTTNTSTTANTTTTPGTVTTNITTSHAAANPASSDAPTYSSCNDILTYGLSAVGIVVFCMISVVVYFTMKKRWCVRPRAPIPAPRRDPATVYYENELTVFRSINEREAAELEENHYEEID